MKVVKDEDAIEVKSEEELLVSIAKICTREISKIEERTGKKISYDNRGYFEEIEKTSNEIASDVILLQKKHQIVLSEIQFEDLLFLVAQFKLNNENKNDNDSNREKTNRYILNRLEILLSLLNDKNIKVGNTIVEQSDEIRMAIFKAIEREMEEKIILGGSDNLDISCCLFEIRAFGYDVGYIQHEINRMKKLACNRHGDAESKSYDMKKIALVLHPDGKPMKNGKVMAYCPMNEVLFIVDLMILCGVINDVQDSNDDKYSKYKRFLDVKELIKEAEFEADISRQCEAEGKSPDLIFEIQSKDGFYERKN